MVLVSVFFCIMFFVTVTVASIPKYRTGLSESKRPVLRAGLAGPAGARGQPCAAPPLLPAAAGSGAERPGSVVHEAAMLLAALPGSLSLHFIVSWRPQKTWANLLLFPARNTDSRQQPGESALTAPAAASGHRTGL